MEKVDLNELEAKILENSKAIILLSPNIGVSYLTNESLRDYQKEKFGKMLVEEKQELQRRNFTKYSYKSLRVRTLEYGQDQKNSKIFTLK